MGKRMYEDLCEMLEGELNTITKKGELTKESLELIDKLTHAIKSVTTIKAMEDAEKWDGGSSYRGYSRGYHAYDGHAYDGGMSNAYSRDYSRDYSMNSYDGRRGRDGDGDGRYSERGYSRADEKSHMMQKLEKMMDDTINPQERQTIQRVMQQLQ